MARKQDLIKFNKAVFALPPAEREQYVRDGKVIAPDDPVKALEELFRISSITEADLLRRESHETVLNPFLRVDAASRQQTMEDFWRLQGWTRIDNRTGEEMLTHANWAESEGTRIEAVRFLLDRVLKKDPRNATEHDFCSNKLKSLLGDYYAGSPYAAVTAAYPELGIRPWEMVVTPYGVFDQRETRVAAVRWLVDKLGKDLRDVTQVDFYSNRLTGFLRDYYGNSPYAAVVEAYPESGIKPWEMHVTPRGFFNNREVRVEAVRWLVGRLGRDPRDVTKGDFYSNRLGGLLSNYYSDSPYEALVEAKLVSRKDEKHMRTRNRIGSLVRS